VIGPQSVVHTLSGDKFAADLYGKDPVLVYTWDGQRITVGRIQIDDPRVRIPHRISLDDNSILLIDPGTMVLLRDGAPRFPSDLKAGNSLLPLYRKLDSGGYPIYWEPGGWNRSAQTTRDSYRWRRVTRMVAEWKMGRRCRSGDIVSYVSKDRGNCHPDNLKIVHKEIKRPARKVKSIDPLFEAQRFINESNHKVAQVGVDVSGDLFSIRGLETSNLAVGEIFLSVDSE
jgi:hypothetical protein